MEERMQWQDLMTRFAELVGRALAARWLADQSTRERPEPKPVEPQTDENDVQLNLNQDRIGTHLDEIQHLLTEQENNSCPTS
jgi:hypothetical protein